MLEIVYGLLKKTAAKIVCFHETLIYHFQTTASNGRGELVMLMTTGSEYAGFTGYSWIGDVKCHYYLRGVCQYSTFCGVLFE